MMGGCLLLGLPLVGLPNIYIYINQKMGLEPWYNILPTNIYLFFFIFETMHLFERLQTFRKVAFWFINSTQDSDRRDFCFWFFLAFSYIHFKKRKTVKEFV